MMHMVKGGPSIPGRIRAGGNSRHRAAGAVSPLTPDIDLNRMVWDADYRASVKRQPNIAGRPVD